MLNPFELYLYTYNLLGYLFYTYIHVCISFVHRLKGFVLEIRNCYKRFIFIENKLYEVIILFFYFKMYNYYFSP